MDKPAEGVGTDHSEQPKDQEQGNDCPEHFEITTSGKESRKNCSSEATQEEEQGISSEARN